MLAKRFSFLSVAVLALFGLSICVSAQIGPVRGVVKLKQADGTLVPAVDVVVEPIRIDMTQGKAPETRTNKNGEFSFAGLNLAAKYVLAVSGPTISPTVSNTVRGGMEGITIGVAPGDGRRLTEAEVREVVKALEASPQTEETVAERKKAKEEYDKQLAKHEAEKKRIENINKIVTASLKDGEAAYKAKDYATAIAKFDEGINADPDFEGTAPIILNYKAVALKSRAFEAYERSAKLDGDAKKSELESAKADFNASIASFERALSILANAKPADVAMQTSLAKVKANLLTNYIETYRLTVKTKADTSRAKDAIPVYEQYFVIEVDPAKKLNAKVTLADILREAGESEPAIAAYRAVLELSPDNADALAGLGLVLFDVGVSENDKAKMQEGMNIMQKFVDTAPENHVLKQSVKDAVEYLKTEQKMAPQKSAPKKRP